MQNLHFALTTDPAESEKAPIAAILMDEAAR